METDSPLHKRFKRSLPKTIGTVSIQNSVAKMDELQHATNATNQNASESSKMKNEEDIVSFDDLAKYASSLPVSKKLFGNHILEGTTVLFPSERGVGKTFLALELALLIAEGCDSFLGEPIEISGNTLYLNMELGKPVIGRRIDKLKSYIRKNPNKSYNAIMVLMV
jgi:RecA-family ATPase